MKRLLLTLIIFLTVSPLAISGDKLSKMFLYYKSDTSAIISPAVIDAEQRGRKLKKFAFGGNVNINFDNSWTRYNTNNGKNDIQNRSDNLFQIVLKPKVCWYLNENMQVGGRIGFSFGNFDMGTKEHKAQSIGRAIGWSLNPYYSYRLIQWKRLGAWIEANVLLGQYYNVKNDYLFASEWSKMTEYGVQILPVLDIYLAEGFSLELHFGILSLGWYGTTAQFDDRKEITSSWDIRKGGLDGLFYGFANYGIGLVRRF